MIEDGLPVKTEGFDEDVLDGQVVVVADIELAAASGLAAMDPVGCSIAGAVETWQIAECLRSTEPWISRR